MQKHKNFSDYMIKDGKLVGEFEEAYQDFEDPWGHLENDQFRTSHFITIGWLQHIAAQKGVAPSELRVLEVGAGLGNLTIKLKQAGFDVLGLEVSETAVKKAQKLFPDCRFAVGDVLDPDYGDFDVILLAEVTWFILDKLEAIINKCQHKDCELVQLVATYPEGVQQYGREYFTNLDEIETYFSSRGLEVKESFALQSPRINGYSNGTWFSPVNES